MFLSAIELLWSIEEPSNINLIPFASITCRSHLCPQSFNVPICRTFVLLCSQCFNTVRTYSCVLPAVSYVIWRQTLQNTFQNSYSSQYINIVHIHENFVYQFTALSICALQECALANAITPASIGYILDVVFGGTKKLLRRCVALERFVGIHAQCSCRVSAKLFGFASEINMSQIVSAIQRITFASSTLFY